MSFDLSRRLDALDGLRGLAVLWVAVYHYTVHWAPSGPGPALLPYGDALAWPTLAAAGELGVSLCFLIAGILVALTLPRSPDAAQFALRRAIRIWPILLICAGLTWLVVLALGPEVLRRSGGEVLLSVLALPPALFGAPGWTWLDGAWWPLWVLVRFYAVAAVLYYVARQPLIRGWTWFAAGSAIVHLGAVSGSDAAATVGSVLFSAHQPFFSAGIALACLMAGVDRRRAWGLLVASVALAVVYAGLERGGLSGGFAPESARLAGLAAVFGLACAAVLRPGLVRWLSWAPLRVFGRASFAYFLLHQNVGLALLLALPFVGPASIGVMLLVQMGLIGLSLALHGRLEPPVNAALRARIGMDRQVRPG